DLPGSALDLPRAWLRLPEPQHESQQETKGLFIYSWDSDRHAQVEHFLRALLPDDRPVLRFLHLVSPHYPWIYLPSGHRYVVDSSMFDFPIGAHGIVGERWGPDTLATRSAHRRYLLQLQHVDRVLGLILDRLEEQNLLDPALLIVTGDHGVAFLPGKSSRDPEPETIAAILPVPLFIKLPGERTSAVSDRNVESIDILPTIADVLKMPLHHPVDGSSLLDEDQPQRPRKTLITPQGPIFTDPTFPDKYKHLDKVLADFGDGRDDRLMVSDVRPDMVGQPVADFKIGPESQAQLVLQWGDDSVLESAPDVYPCFYKGMVRNADEVKLPITIAVALNGEIAGVTQTLRDPESPELWSVLIDERRFHLGKNELEFYQVLGEGEKTELRRCAYHL
ncbi:MAG: sulfatase-like hydrolase/transferase, partial [Planctomycetaceae bacterium]